MIIRDKQDLRKCVKQCVRRARVIETSVEPVLLTGDYGVSGFAKLGSVSPFAAEQAGFLSALDALNLPVHDLDKAETILKGYDREAYLALVLDAMRAERVLLRVPLEQAGNASFADERLVPLLVADAALFAPGRYGTDYAKAARQIAEGAALCGAQDVALDVFDESALRYCLLPACEDHALALHMHIRTREELDGLAVMLLDFPQACALVSAEDWLEAALIRAAQKNPRIVARLGSEASIPAALSVLGTGFVPYASHANTPEAMLGQWILLKETLWQSLCEVYLPLARTGYELTREQVEQDVHELLCGSYMKLHV